MAKHLYDVLLNDLANPRGLTPLFGIEERGAMVAERIETERRLAGEALMNTAALVACLRANLRDHRAGVLTTDGLLQELDATLETLDAQLRYDEATALVSDESEGSAAAQAPQR